MVKHKIAGLILLLLIMQHTPCFAQLNDATEKAGETTGYTNNPFDSGTWSQTPVFSFEKKYSLKWQTFGVNYDAVNSALGLLVSNGLDERPTIDFEDIETRIFYRISGQTDFNKSYAFDAKLGWDYPISHTRIALLAVEYLQRDFRSVKLFQRDLNLSAEIGFRHISLIVKTGYQELNNNHHLGAEAGLEKNISLRLYFGASAGYYNNYQTYAAYLQSRVIRQRLSIRIAYDRVAQYDFLNMGLLYSFKR